MLNWVILAIAAIIAAALAGVIVHAGVILAVLALIAVYLEPKENER